MKILTKKVPRDDFERARVHQAAKRAQGVVGAGPRLHHLHVGYDQGHRHVEGAQLLSQGHEGAFYEIYNNYLDLDHEILNILF